MVSRLMHRMQSCLRPQHTTQLSVQLFRATCDGNQLNAKLSRWGFLICLRQRLLYTVARKMYCDFYTLQDLQLLKYFCLLGTNVRNAFGLKVFLLFLTQSYFIQFDKKRESIKLHSHRKSFHF